MSRTSSRNSARGEGRDDGHSRRDFLAAAGVALAAASLPAETARGQSPVPSAAGDVTGTDHWTIKRAGADNVKLYLRRKRQKSADTTADRGTILFVHGSSVSATR